MFEAAVTRESVVSIGSIGVGDRSGKDCSWSPKLPMSEPEVVTGSDEFKRHCLLVTLEHCVTLS